MIGSDSEGGKTREGGREGGREKYSLNVTGIVCVFVCVCVQGKQVK